MKTDQPDKETLIRAQTESDILDVPEHEIIQHIASHSRIMAGSPIEGLTNNDLVVMCVVKDGEAYVREFIEHYLRLAPRQIIFLDNGSTDETIRIAREFPGTVVVECLLPYKVFFQAFKRYLIKTYGLECWGLVVDIDEFFDWPCSDVIPVTRLLEYLNEMQFDVVVAQMLDMFPDSPLGKLDNISSTLRSEHRYYDISDITKIDYQPKNKISNRDIKYHLGGIRKSFFGLEKINITKHPLVKYSPGMFIKNDHAIEYAKVADFSCVLLHYKYVSNFKNYVKDAVDGEYHFDNSSQYKAYLSKVSDEPDATMMSNTMGIRCSSGS